MEGQYTTQPGQPVGPAGSQQPQPSGAQQGGAAGGGQPVSAALLQQHALQQQRLAAMQAAAAGGAVMPPGATPQMPAGARMGGVPTPSQQQQMMMLAHAHRQQQMQAPQGAPAAPVPATAPPGLSIGSTHLSENTQILTRQKLQELVKQVSPNERLEPDVEEVCTSRSKLILR